jgi:catechol 2,3-dioxygenase-like lactoylglutathione lyase family enzyme
MLGNADLIAFVPTRDPQKSRRFYEQTLGLEFVSEDPFALVFRAHGVMLRIVNASNVKDFIPAPFTILGWRVSSAESTVRALLEKGIEFERFPGVDQNPLGIWRSPSGAQVAWFKDPDGNVLSITEV